MDATERVRRATLYAGVVAAVVSFLAIATAVALAPWFSFTGNALSDLGRRSTRSAPVFNAGTALAGGLGAVFVLRVAAAERGAVARLGQTLLLGATLALSGVGLVPAGDPSGLHGPVSVAFFVLLTYGLAADGSATALAGHVREGLLSVWLALANVTGWVVYAAVAAASESAPGVALPELVGAVGMAAWAVSKTRRLRTSAARRHAGEGRDGGGGGERE